MPAQKKFATVDEYIQSFPKDVQGTLLKVRRRLRKVVPGAVEIISYGIPCLNLNGKNLVFFAGWKSHISMYPVPAGTVAYRKAVARYIGGKGTIKFPISEPIPYYLVEKTARYLLKEKKGALYK